MRPAVGISSRGNEAVKGIARSEIKGGEASNTRESGGTIGEGEMSKRKSGGAVVEAKTAGGPCGQKKSIAGKDGYKTLADKPGATENWRPENQRNLSFLKGLQVVNSPPILGVLNILTLPYLWHESLGKWRQRKVGERLVSGRGWAKAAR